MTKIKQINDPSLSHTDVGAFTAFPYYRYPTVGDIAQLNADVSDKQQFWGYYLRIKKCESRPDVVIVFHVSADIGDVFELPADMPSVVLQWLAYVYKLAFENGYAVGKEKGRKAVLETIRETLELSND